MAVYSSKVNVCSLFKMGSCNQQQVRTKGTLPEALIDHSCSMVGGSKKVMQRHLISRSSRSELRQVCVTSLRLAMQLNFALTPSAHHHRICHQLPSLIYCLLATHAGAAGCKFLLCEDFRVISPKSQIAQNLLFFWKLMIDVAADRDQTGVAR